MSNAITCKHCQKQHPWSSNKAGFWVDCSCGHSVLMPHEMQDKRSEVKRSSTPVNILPQRPASHVVVIFLVGIAIQLVVYLLDLNNLVDSLVGWLIIGVIHLVPATLIMYFWLPHKLANQGSIFQGIIKLSGIIMSMGTAAFMLQIEVSEYAPLLMREYTFWPTLLMMLLLTGMPTAYIFRLTFKEAVGFSFAVCLLPGMVALVFALAMALIRPMF